MFVLTEEERVPTVVTKKMMELVQAMAKNALLAEEAADETQVVRYVHAVRGLGSCFWLRLVHTEDLSDVARCLLLAVYSLLLLLLLLFNHRLQTLSCGIVSDRVISSHVTFCHFNSYHSMPRYAMA